ncbi:hypothetical protein Q5P01_001898 [Channa striata]|uniref:Uncharacterized protein n=1 Tax=Channa striata TaxID=64152 RepID=A0AA88NQ37_CHASR|nr:hypothetical protein Q5P01_001898 [Channa striata]
MRAIKCDSGALRVSSFLCLLISDLNNKHCSLSEKAVCPNAETTAGRVLKCTVTVWTRSFPPSWLSCCGKDDTFSYSH